MLQAARLTPSAACWRSFRLQQHDEKEEDSSEEEEEHGTGGRAVIVVLAVQLGEALSFDVADTSERTCAVVHLDLRVGGRGRVNGNPCCADACRTAACWHIVGHGVVGDTEA